MNINFGPRGVIEINNARVIYRNFAGRGDKYNREGDRNFAVVIPNEELKDALVNDLNKYGVGWNVKIKPGRDEDEAPFMYLQVKVKYSKNDRGETRGPDVYLKSGNAVNRLTEDMVDMLDEIDIESVDLDVRPYDDIISGKPFRAAYLQSIWVTQKVDRFAERFAAAEE